MASNQQVGNIVYQVQMDVAQLLDAQRKVNERLDKMDGGFKKVGSSADKLSTGMSKVGVAIAAAFTIQTAQKVINIADSMAILQARINRLSVDAADGANNMQRLAAIASTTGSSIADTAKLWETLTASLKEYGATNDQVVRVTETLQKIGTIGGSSAEEMSNALRQFGQSIAGGTVRAEEFNSILENMPELGRQIAKGLGMSLGELRQEMLAGKLTAEDALNAIQKQTASVDAEFAKLPVSVERAKNKLDVAFDTAIQKIDQAIGLTRTLSSLISSVADNLTLALNSYGELGNLEPLMKKQVDLQKEINDLQKDGKQWYETQLTYQAKLNEKRRELLQVEGELVNIRSKQKKPAEAGQKSETAPFSIPSGQTDKDAEKAAKAAAKAQKARETAAAKASAKEQTAAERAEESRTKKLQDLSNEMAVAALKSKGLNREAAQLAAVQELGAGATQAQIQQAQQQAGQIFDIQQQAADKKAAIDADSAAKAKQQRDLDNAQLDRQLKAGDVTFEQSQQRRAQIAADYSKAIADANSQAVVTPQQQLAGQVDPVQQLANENAQKLALIKEYTAQRVITEEQGLALMNAANTEYEAQRTAAQWQLLSQQGLGYDMLTSAVDAFAGNASNAITGLLTGTMSVSDAMRSLGSTILNSVINSLVQVGVEALKNFIIGQTMGDAAAAASVGQAAVVASAWAPAAAMTSLATLGANSVPAAAAITSTVGLSSGLALAGMRKNGGPVSAGSMYRVGEGGAPELLQSGGKNYMIPGDGGKVISNADLQTGGGGNIQVTVVFNDNTSGSHAYDAQASQDGNNLTIQAFIMDMDNKGPMHSAITRNTTATSRATGAKMAIPYPDWLPIAQKSDKSPATDTGFRTDQPLVGAPIFQKLTDDLKTSFSLKWIFTFTQHRAFMQWLRSPNYLDNCNQWFSMRLNNGTGDTGIELQELHFTACPTWDQTGNIFTWSGDVICRKLNNADDEFDDIIVELPPPWDSWLDIIVTGYPDDRDPESLPRVP